MAPALKELPIRSSGQTKGPKVMGESPKSDIVRVSESPCSFHGLLAHMCSAL